MRVTLPTSSTMPVNIKASGMNRLFYAECPWHLEFNYWHFFATSAGLLCALSGKKRLPPSWRRKAAKGAKQLGVPLNAKRKVLIANC
jgi:hypothetical protein